MLTVGKYSYPNQVTFAEALKIAEIAVKSFEGKMSNKDVAEALGYKIKSPEAISGYIFRKLDDIAAYNLMKRQRGFMKVTDLALQALDPYDPANASMGKCKAILQIPIVKRANEEWKGELPAETGFPSKLVDLLGIPWQEAQKHAEPLRKLFTELFPYLKEVGARIGAIERGVERVEKALEEIEKESPTLRIVGELRTEEYGVLKIKDEVSIDMAIRLLQSLRDRLTASKEEAGKKTE